MKKILDLDFKIKNFNGDNRIISLDGIKYENIAKYLATFLVNRPSKDPIKMKCIAEELFKTNKVILDISDIQFLKSHVSLLQLPVIYEAPILMAFINAEEVKIEKKK